MSGKHDPNTEEAKRQKHHEMRSEQETHGTQAEETAPEPRCRELQSCRATELQSCRAAELQSYRAAELQSYRATELQSYRVLTCEE